MEISWSSLRDTDTPTEPVRLVMEARKILVKKFHVKKKAIFILYLVFFVLYICASRRQTVL